MGKISILTKSQREILNQIVRNNYILENFYLTGGTALSEVYLKHRLSEDLDFFTDRKYDTLIIANLIKQISNGLGCTFQSELLEFLYRFNLTLPNSQVLKLDFSYYPYKRVEKGKVFYKGLIIDSLLDIAINKLSTIQQRYNVKDFVDLYFLLDKLSLWDLIEGVRVKFRMEIEPWILASDLIYSVEKFDSLPRMIKPLTLKELKIFYRNLAKELGRKTVI